MCEFHKAKFLDFLTSISSVTLPETLCDGWRGMNKWVVSATTRGTGTHWGEMSKRAYSQRGPGELSTDQTGYLEEKGS